MVFKGFFENAANPHCPERSFYYAASTLVNFSFVCLHYTLVHCPAKNGSLVPLSMHKYFFWDRMLHTISILGSLICIAKLQFGNGMVCILHSLSCSFNLFFFVKQLYFFFFFQELVRSLELFLYYFWISLELSAADVSKV